MVLVWKDKDINWSSFRINKILGNYYSWLLIVRFVGKLVGRYYDSEGNPTKYLKGVEAKAARGAQLLEKQKNEEAKQPSCNSRWSQDEGGEVCLPDVESNYRNQAVIVLLSQFL